MSTASADVAIVGMAALFPRAPDAQTLWQNVCAKVDAISDPLDWPEEFVCDPASSANDRVYTRRGGYLGELVRFDPTAYGVMPRAVDGGEPEHFVALRLAHEALVDAGYAERPFPRERTAVILGRGTYVNRGMIAALQHGIVVDQTIRLLATLVPDRTPAELERLRQLLKAQLPPFNSETAQSLAHSAMCGRIANRLDLMGPAYTVDAACASSLIAVGQAAQALREGTCDVALAGGIQISTSFPIAVLFCQLGALSRSGQLRPFHPEADGTLLGEGAGVLVLKRLADAVRDEDRIYSVVKGVGIASDGRAMGVLTPRVEGEELALRRAYAAAGIGPETIGLLEAHGTGTVAGDATELEALHRVFAPRERGPRCALGSIKSMIGHSIPAAGSAGLVKAALALHYRVLPPTLYADEQPPKLANGPFYLNSETRPWVHGAEAPRRAGVSAFGFGGINAHVILEEWEPPATPRGRTVAVTPGPRDSELVVVWGASRAELVARIAALRDVLSRDGAPALADLAAGLAAAFDPGVPWRLAVVATTAADLAAKLGHAAARLADDRCARIKDRSGIFFFAEPLAREGGLAFLFPGEGAQHANMLRELAVHFPAVREAFDRMDRAARLRGERVVPSEGVFPAPGDEEAARRLWEMDGAVEAVFAADQALAALLGQLGIVPEAIVGHSSGEYAALLAAGAVRLEAEGDLIDKMHAMSRLGGAAAARGLVIEAPLLAVSPTAPEQVPDLLARADGTLHLAMDNCPHQVVLAGTEEAIAAAHAELRAAGAMCQRLPFARGYHTPLFAPFRDEMRPFFDAIEFVTPAIPLWSCVTAAPMPADGAEIRRLALGQWAHRVRFRETIEAMWAAGVRLFVEVGPRANLTAFVDDVLKQRPHAAIATNVERRSALLQLHHAVALMVAHGVPVRLAALHEGRRGSPLSPEALFGTAPGVATASRSMRLPMALPVLRAGAAEREAFGAARPASSETVTAPPASLPIIEPTAGAVVTGGAADVLMSEYLRTMEEFLTTQEDVMRAFLGGSAPTAPDAAPRPEPPAPPVAGNGHGASPVEPPAMPPPAASAPAALDADGVRALLVRLISDRTGYPPDMIDPAASLEADLGIDSIKRVEILGALDAETGLVGQDMEGITGLRTLDELVAQLAARAGGRAPARVARPEPSLAAKVVRRDGDAFVMRATLSLARERFLLEHPLGGRVADDPSLRALPVCPLAMTLELLAESAAVALGTGRPVGLRGVRASRWLAFARPEVALEVTVRRLDAERAHVVVRRVGSDDVAEPDPPVVEATVLLADRFAAPAPARSLALDGACAPRWTPEELYDPTQVHGMFHGPAFQGVGSLDRIGTNGAEATLRVPPAGALIASCATPGFALDPVVLDAAGQVLGFWNAQQLDPGILVFPVAVDAIDVFGESLASPADARCRVHVRRVEPHRIVADLDVLGPDDRPHLRVSGWEVKRFALPERFYAFRLNPRDVMLSRPVPEMSEDGRACVAFEVPEGFLESDGGIWRDAMAFLVLGAGEREAWRALPGSDARRREWLMGRIAAKDAVREWLRRRGAVVHAADVEVVVGPENRPEVRGPWAGRVHVSVSHSDGVAVGIASACEVGIDVERVGRTRPDFERAAFTPAERALLDALPAARDEWALRLWCAKEAAVKALGRGFVNGPGDAVATAVDAASGLVDVIPAGALAAHPGPIRARTERVEDIVLAVAEIVAGPSIRDAEAAVAAD